MANSLKPEVKAVKEMAALSTASIGKFDKKLKGEKEGRPKVLSQPGLQEVNGTS